MSLAFPVAAEPDPDRLEAGRRLFAGPVDFLKGVVDVGGLPPGDRLEVAFAGRSNVGKSTLINALTGRRALARASNTPGRTREINYFAVGDALYLVDLPGYGYAEAPVAAVARWQALLRAYLAGRPTLRRAFLLVDARHGLKPPDLEIIGLLSRAAVPFQPVLTKADKPPRAALERVVEGLRARLAREAAAFPEIALTSAATGAGIDVLRARIAGMLAGGDGADRR